MNKLNKRLLFVLATLSSMVIASCGESGGGNGDIDVDMTVDTRGTEISMWTSFGTDITTVLTGILEDFQDETGIKVVHEPKGGYSGLQEAVTLAGPSGNYANVIIGYPDHFAGYINSNIQLRLDFLIEHDTEIPEYREDDEDFVELPSIDMSTFYSDYMNENTNLEFKEDGTGYVLGLPFNKSTELMIYNKTFIDYASNVNNKIKVPETYDELDSVGTEILNYLNSIPHANGTGVGLLPNSTNGMATGLILGSDGKAYVDEASMKAASASNTSIIDLTSVTNDYPFRVFSYDSTDNFFITLVRNYGGSYTELDKSTNKGYVAFDNENTRRALNKVKSLSDKGILGIPATWNEQSYTTNAFKKECCLFAISSSAGVPKNVNSSRYELGVAPVLGGETEEKYVISQGTNLAILDKGADKEIVASWKLLKYLTQEVDGYFSYATGYYPCSTTAMNSTVYQQFLNDAGGSASDIATREAAKVNSRIYMSEDSKWVKFVDNAFVGSSLIRSEVETIIPQVIEGTYTIDEILQNAYANLSSYVR